MGPTQRRSSDDVTSSRQRRLERQHLGRHPYDVLTRLHDCNYGTQFSGNIYLGRMGSVVVVQLAELSIPTPEDQGSNSAVRNFIKNIYLLSTVYKRLNVGNCPFRKKHWGRNGLDNWKIIGKNQLFSTHNRLSLVAAYSQCSLKVLSANVSFVNLALSLNGYLFNSPKRRSTKCQQTTSLSLIFQIPKSNVNY